MSDRENHQSRVGCGNIHASVRIIGTSAPSSPPAQSCSSVLERATCVHYLHAHSVRVSFIRCSYGVRGRRAPQWPCAQMGLSRRRVTTHFRLHPPRPPRPSHRSGRSTRDPVALATAASLSLVRRGSSRHRSSRGCSPHPQASRSLSSPLASSPARSRACPTFSLFQSEISRPRRPVSRQRRALPAVRVTWGRSPKTWIPCRSPSRRRRRCRTALSAAATGTAALAGAEIATGREARLSVAMTGAAIAIAGTASTGGRVPAAGAPFSPGLCPVGPTRTAGS